MSSTADLLKMFAALATLSFLALPVAAQDISGSYTLDVAQDPGADDCVWAGTLTLNQSGGNPGTFTGTGDVDVTAGPCVDFTGTVTGSINGSALTIGVGTGGLGTVNFTGTVTSADSIGGSWSGLGLTGTWSASRTGSGSADPVPAMSAPWIV